MTFQTDLRAETPVVPLHWRNLEAVTWEEGEGTSEGLVKPWRRLTEVRKHILMFNRDEVSQGLTVGHQLGCHLKDQLVQQTPAGVYAQVSQGPDCCRALWGVMLWCCRQQLKC